MIYFLYVFTFICIFNLLLMGWITWKFGKEVFFGNSKECVKDIAVERTH